MLALPGGEYLLFLSPLFLRVVLFVRFLFALLCLLFHVIRLCAFFVFDCLFDVFSALLLSYAFDSIS